MTPVTNVSTGAKDSPQQLKETSHAHPVRDHCRGHSRSRSLGICFNRYETVWRGFDLANGMKCRKLTDKGDCFDVSLVTLAWCRVKPDWQVQSRFTRDHSCPLARMAQRFGLQPPRQQWSISCTRPNKWRALVCAYRLTGSCPTAQGVS